MFNPLFTGCATALVTPFLPDGRVDEKALRRLIARQIDAGVDALVLLGTTGEPCTLSLSERQRVLEIGMEEVNGRIPIIAGTGSNSTEHAVKYAKQAQKLGITGQLSVTPYYNKAIQTGLLRHFTAVLEACDLPMIVYNVPGRTGMNIHAETVEKLSRLEGVVGIKEASGNFSLTADILALTNGTFPVYCGNDDQILPMMAMGAVGAVSVVSNVVPEEARLLTEACLSGKLDTARMLQTKLLPLIRALFSQVSPIPAKAALSMMGLMEDELRLPLTPMEEPYRENLKKELRALKLID